MTNQLKIIRVFKTMSITWKYLSKNYSFSNKNTHFTRIIFTSKPSSNYPKPESLQLFNIIYQNPSAIFIDINFSSMCLLLLTGTHVLYFINDIKISKLIFILYTRLIFKKFSDRVTLVFHL